jgi:hypothetical protein
MTRLIAQTTRNSVSPLEDGVSACLSETLTSTGIALNRRPVSTASTHETHNPMTDFERAPGQVSLRHDSRKRQRLEAR